MKKLLLQNPSFRYLKQAFQEWLDIQGYAYSTVQCLPSHIQELLFNLEQKGIYNIKQLNQECILNHYQNLKARANQRYPGGLSNAHLNKHIQAIKKFTTYLHLTKNTAINTSNLKRENTIHSINYLSLKEVRALFEASYQLPDIMPNLPSKVLDAIQARDRAMLAIFYGCGLRRNEGVQLNINDIDFDKALLHVKKGKNYKQRIVPISKKNLHYLVQYVYDHRPDFLRKSKQDALFLTATTTSRMQPQTLSRRLKNLQLLSRDPELIQKKIGLHTLRHAIATHLMQAGMILEAISRFLGHQSLESTQIYTHLTHESN